MPIPRPWNKGVIASANLMKAFASPARLRILNLLLQSEVCHCHIARALQMPERVVDNNLAALRKHKIVVSMRGKFYVYHSVAVADDPLFVKMMEAVRLLSAQLKVFQEDLARLKLICENPAAADRCPHDVRPSMATLQ